jgi:CMP-N,N'-diacetyllegionaminic acid synthase
VPGKNVRPLAGHPLLAYTIVSARETGLFDAVVVSTDDEHTARLAAHYGAEVPELRPDELGGATSPDIAWIEHMLEALARRGRSFDIFALLRPTSPFRGAATIKRAWERLVSQEGRIDSIRAVEPCKQHPGKMWLLHGDDLMTPLLLQPEELPFHSCQYAALPEVYVQNSSIEVAWTRVAMEDGSIAGRRVAPLRTDPLEGFSIDYEGDWEEAERLVESGGAVLPRVEAAPYEAVEAPG